MAECPSFNGTNVPFALPGDPGSSWYMYKRTQSHSPNCRSIGEWMRILEVFPLLFWPFCVLTNVKISKFPFGSWLRFSNQSLQLYSAIQFHDSVFVEQVLAPYDVRKCMKYHHGILEVSATSSLTTYTIGNVRWHWKIPPQTGQKWRLESR